MAASASAAGDVSTIEGMLHSLSLEVKADSGKAGWVIEQLLASVASLRKDITEKQVRNKDLEADVLYRDAAVQRLRNTTAEQEARLAELQGRVVQLEEQISGGAASRHQPQDATEQLEVELEGLRCDLAYRDLHMQDLKSDIADKERCIGGLVQENRSLKGRLRDAEARLEAVDEREADGEAMEI